MTLRKVLFLLSFLLFSNTSFSQQGKRNYRTFCASTRLQNILNETHPEILQRQILNDNLSALYFRQSVDGKLEADYILPVVVHIIHNNGSENISDATVEQGIQDLNAAYANVGYYDPSTGVDTRIQFCLAKRAVDGAPTTGITRNTSSLTTMTLETDDLTVKSINRWDPTKYINIWLVKEICSNSVGCGVAGYSTFPASHGMANDGIVIESRWFGSTRGNSGAHVHEIGHYLGLYHTFQGGCTNNDCLTDGDHVCDTPPDQSTVAVPCDATVNSCSTDTDSGFATDQNDLTHDYMDYGNWDCYSMFTQGQTDRMHYFIENVRASLLESEGCQDPCLSNITASFTFDNPVNVGESVNFTNTTTNGTNFEWQINGVIFSNIENPVYTFNAQGIYEITLIATNADPNCYDEISLPINVLCPVEASFSASDYYPSPGTTVDFTNESQNAITYKWSVDGTVLTSNQDFSYIFPHAGAFQVCLTADNGTCSEDFCKFILASDEGTGDCVGTFIRKIGNYGENEDPHAIQSLGNGKFVIGFGKDDRSVFSILNENGDVESSKSFNFMSGNDFFRVLTTDSDGNLIAHARDQLSSNTDNFIIKYDIENDVLLWSKEYPSPSNTRMERIIEISPGGNYLVVGFTAGKALIMEINRNTGNLIWQKNFSVGPHFLLSDVIVSGGYIYVSGSQQRVSQLDKMRASLSKLDLSGNLIWNRIYLRSLNSSARNYASSLVIDGNNIVSVARGNINGSDLSNSDSQLFKTDLSGEIVFGKNYHIVGAQTAGAGHVMNLADGYIFLGSFLGNDGRDIYFIKTDKTGNVIWAKSIGTPATESSIRFEMYNNFIYFFAKTTGYDTGSNYDCLFGKMSTDGEISGNGCELVKDIHVETEDITYDNEVSVTESTPTNPLNDFPIVAGEVSIDVDNIPGCECDEFSTGSEECVGTFIRKIGNEGENEEGKILFSKGDGQFFCGGKKDNDAFLFTVDKDGNLLAEKTFDLTPGGCFVDNVIRDTGGDLVILARDRTNSETDNFVIKYNATAESVIWTKEYPIPAYTRFEGITELNSGNYLISGFIGSSGNAGDAILIEIDRNTGELIWQKSYGLGSFQLFLNPLEQDGAIFACGFERANGGPDKIRASMTKLDYSGNVIWNRIYFNSPSATGRTYLTDFQFIGSSIMALSRGSLTSANYSNSDFQLSNLNNDGEINWAKNYHIAGGTYTQGRVMKKIPGGYILQGRYQLNGDLNFFFVKVDDLGNVIWSKSIGTDSSDDCISFDIYSNYIYFFGKTQAFDSGDNYDSLFGKMSLDGEISGNGCELVTDMVLEVEDISDAYDGEIALSVGTPTNPLNNVSVVPIDVDVAVENVPGCECDEYAEPSDDCTLKPDATINLNSFECVEGSKRISVAVCNQGLETLPTYTPISFYRGNPITEHVIPFATIFTEEEIIKDDCLVFSFQYEFDSNIQIFAVVNDNGTTLTPFSLDENFGNTDIIECNYPNNIDDLNISYSTPTLDLGPDIISCDNQVVVLDAGNDFFEYLWSDGTIEQTITTFFEGTYSVTVTDACGIEQTDNVQITIDPVTQLDLGVDTAEICLGDTITFSIEGYDGYQWFPTENVSCANCDSISIAVDTTVLVILVANNELGCFTTDSVFINPVDTISAEDTIFLCPSDSVIINGTTYYAPTIVEQLISSQETCDTLKKIHIEPLEDVPDATLSFTDISCSNGNKLATVTICNQGNADLPSNTPLTFYMGNPLLENATVLLTITTPQTIASGDCMTLTVELNINNSADVFAIINDSGTTSTPFNLSDALSDGFFFECDISQNISRFSFNYTPPVLNLGMDLSSCENEPIVLNAGAGFDSYIWSDTSVEQQLMTNSTGTYAVTVTDVCGGMQMDEIEIEINPAPSIDLGIDTLVVCSGDTISFNTNTYSTYHWTPDEIFDCNTCDSVSFVIGDTSLIVVLEVENEYHCKALDSVHVNVTDTIFSEETIHFCFDDTLYYEGVPYTESTTLNKWLPAIIGCDTLKTIQLVKMEALEPNINPTRTICAGSCAELSITANRTIDSIYWLGTDMDDNNSVTPIVCPIGNESGLTTYVYDVIITDSFGCRAAATTIVQVTEPLSMSVSKDTSICRFNETRFSVKTNLSNNEENGIITFVWSEFPGNPNQNQNIIVDSSTFIETKPLNISGQYIFTVTAVQNSPDGLEHCRTSDQIVVKVEDCDDCGVYIPNIFSPNNDNINDTFSPFIICDLKQFNMKIFDRWGGKVYETTDIKQGWDGRFHDKPAPIDVYVFVITGILNGEEKIFAGDITLVR